MKAVLQRVLSAQVDIKGETISSINKGLLILLGIEKDDTEKIAMTLAAKCSKLRIMSDDMGKMNKSVIDTSGEALVVSQFTLCADVSRGRRPSFISAMDPEKAKKLYELFCSKLESNNICVKRGAYGEYMIVSLVNDGPVTIVLNTTI